MLTAQLLPSLGSAGGRSSSGKSRGNSLGFSRGGGSLERPALLEQCLLGAYSPEVNPGYMFL